MLELRHAHRRAFLQAGGAGLLGLSLPRLLAAESQQSPATAKSVIFLFLFGGPSQLETFDMKPLAPVEVRGEFATIAARTPELLMCEQLSRLAAISDRFSIVRTLSHDYNDHSGGGHYIQTGKRWHIPIGGGFNATPEDWPSIGSVVDYLQQRETGIPRDLPNYIVAPNALGSFQTYTVQLRRPGEYAGWLGRGFDPVTTRISKKEEKDNPFFRDCSDEELNFGLDGMEAPLGLTTDRQLRRGNLLAQFDQTVRAFDATGSAGTFNRFQQQAFQLVSSTRTREALDIRRETDKTRDIYGRNLFGQSTLLARRLVEAGTRFVTVHWDAPDGYSWDSHINAKDVRAHLLPNFDQAVAALLTDLQDRGLLDSTLVVAVGEMGRTPKVNRTGGRDHWAYLFPALLAGGGVQGGRVLGQTDREAAYALHQPWTPEDLAATIYQALGIDPDFRLSDRFGRPVPLVEDGRPITELFV